MNTEEGDELLLILCVQLPGLPLGEVFSSLAASVYWQYFCSPYQKCTFVLHIKLSTKQPPLRFVLSGLHWPIQVPISCFVQLAKCCWCVCGGALIEKASLGQKA